MKSSTIRDSLAGEVCACSLLNEGLTGCAKSCRRPGSRVRELWIAYYDRDLVRVVRARYSSTTTEHFVFEH